MNPIRQFIAVACVAWLGACATVMGTSRSGFPSSYAELKPSSDGSSASTRSGMAIDPARVTLGDIEGHAAAVADLGEEQRHALLNQLRNELMSRVPELPPVPEGRPAVLRAAITRFETVSPALNAVSALLFVVTLNRGGTSVEMEALEPGTSKQVAALTLGHFAPLSELKSHFSKLAPAELALRKAAIDFSAFWHLFGDEAGRALAAGWDALPLHGETLFSLLGPVMNDDPVVASQLQDAWEGVFLPTPQTAPIASVEA
jgi:hypothetical protein